MSARPVRAAFLGTRGLPGHGGAERVVEAVVRRLPEHGIEPTVYCERRYTSEDVRIPGVRLVRLGSPAGKHVRPVVRNLLAASHAVARRRYDVVHLHHVEAAFVLPLLRLRYPVLATSHGAAYRRRKWSPLARRLIRLMEYPFVSLANQITFVSRFDREEIGSRRGRHGRHVPNGIDPDPPRNSDGAARVRAVAGIESDRYLLFVADRIIPTKGAHHAVRALALLGDAVPLLIVGDQQHAPAYCQRLRAEASPAVRFHPPIHDSATLFSLMAEASCLVFPSTYEAMSLTLLEVSSCGTPAVATDIASNRDILGDAAWYCEVDDAESLAAGCREILAEPERAARIGAAARERVVSRFSWDRTAARYAEMLHELVRGAPR